MSKYLSKSDARGAVLAYLRVMERQELDPAPEGSAQDLQRLHDLRAIYPQAPEDWQDFGGAALVLLASCMKVHRMGASASLQSLFHAQQLTELIGTTDPAPPPTENTEQKDLNHEP